VTDDIVTRLVTDDIVTRLRLLSASQKAHRFGDLLDDWSGEAADEIKRLKAQLDRANQRAEYWSQMFDTLNDDLNNRLQDDQEVTLDDE
jgi:hypothetical protein